MITYVWRQLFDRVAECGTRHGRGIAVEKAAEPLLISLSGFSDPTAHRLLDQVVRIVYQNLADAEGVIQIAAADKEPGTDHGGPTLIPMVGACKPIERLA